MSGTISPRLSGDFTPTISSMYRLQFEAAQGSWVLLYPEGMVRLNGPAGEILRRCNGALSVDALVTELEQSFGVADLRDDVYEFLEDAHGRGWIV